jgi:hypothetical protein
LAQISCPVNHRPRSLTKNAICHRYTDTLTNRNTETYHVLAVLDVLLRSNTN